MDNHHVFGNRSMEVIGAAGTSCSTCIENKKEMEKIVQQNHLIRAMVGDVLIKLQEIEMKLSSKIIPEEKEPTFFEKHESVLQFPVSTIQNMELLEDILKDETEMNSAVLDLSSVGGKNNYNFVKRALTSVLTNDLCLQYSWLGRKEKKDFHSLKLATVIIRAAEKAGLAANKRETEISMQLWLKRACDRKFSASKKL